MRIAQFLFFILIVAACAKPNRQPDQSDPFLRKWVSEGAPAWTIDTKDVEFGTPSPIWWIYEKGLAGECISIATWTENTPGDKSSGTVVVQSSTATKVSPGDPPCSMFDGNWTWTVTGSAITLCQNTPGVRPCVEMN